MLLHLKKINFEYPMDINYHESDERAVKNSWPSNKNVNFATEKGNINHIIENG